MKITYLYAIILSLTSCSGEWLGCKTSTERKVSPVGNLELFIESKDCGATTSEVKKMYIVKKNNEPSFLNSPVFKVDRIEKLDVAWLNEDQVIINYSKASIHEFKNYWHNVEDGNIEYNVELTLVKKL